MTTMSQRLDREIATIENSPSYFNSMMNTLPNPDKVLRKAGKTQEAYEEVETYSRVYTCLDSRKSAIHALDYEIKGKNEIQTEFVKKSMKNIGVSKLINDVFKCVPWGWQPIELIWKPVNAKWEIIRADAKPHELFMFSPDEKLSYVSKNSYIYTPVNDLKFICPQFEYEYGNPYGNALYGKLFWAVIYAKNILKFGLDFLERFGFPWIVAKHAFSEGDEQISTLIANLMEMRRGGVTAISDQASVELLNSGDKSNSDAFTKMVQFFNDDIAITVLGGNLQTETRGGSYAASDSQNEVRLAKRDRDAELITHNINSIIKKIIDVNFGEQTEYPEFSFIWQDEIKKELAEYNKIMTEVGIEFTPVYYERKHGLLPDEYKIATKPQPKSESGNAFAEQSKFQFDGESGQEIIDQAVSRMSKEDAEKQINPMLKPIIEMISNSKSYAECMEKIAETFPKMNSNAMQEMLNTSLALSEIIGSESQKGDLANSLKSIKK